MSLHLDSFGVLESLDNTLEVLTTRGTLVKLLLQLVGDIPASTHSYVCIPKCAIERNDQLR